MSGKGEGADLVAPPGAARVPLTIRNLDRLIAATLSVSPGEQRVAPADGVRFEQAGENPATSDRDVLHGSPEYREILARRPCFWRRGNPVPPGWITFRGCHILGSAGMILDRRHRILWAGRSVRSTPGQIASHFLPLFGNDAAMAGERIIVDRAALDRLLAGSTGLPRAYHLAGGGLQIYGHALLDFAPRAFRIFEDDADGAPIITDHSRINRAIFAAIGLDPARFRDARPDRVFRVGELRVHSAFRPGLMDERVYGAMVAAMQRHALGRQPPGAARKLYISRSQLARQVRIFANVEEIEAFLDDAGWQRVRPETLAFADQIRTFSEAAAIIGDDGSGLHNSLFAPAGARIVCLDHDRQNLAHLRVANLRRHRIMFVPSDRAAGGRVMPVARLARALDSFGLGRRGD